MEADLIFKFAGGEIENRPPSSSRSIMEVISSIQRSKTGIQDWSLSDLTVGLYLLYLRQASANPFEDFNGLQISSEQIVVTYLLIATLPFLFAEYLHVELKKICVFIICMILYIHRYVYVALWYIILDYYAETFLLGIGSVF